MFSGRTPTDEKYFLLKFFENNHKCVPFGLFITNINSLLLLIFFLSLAVFGFILNIKLVSEINDLLFFMKEVFVVY
jgi:hypothetical protein